MRKPIPGIKIKKQYHKELGYKFGKTETIESAIRTLATYKTGYTHQSSIPLEKYDEYDKNIKIIYDFLLYNEEINKRTLQEMLNNKELLIIYVDEIELDKNSFFEDEKHYKKDECNENIPENFFNTLIKKNRYEFKVCSLWNWDGTLYLSEEGPDDLHNDYLCDSVTNELCSRFPDKILENLSKEYQQCLEKQEIAKSVEEQLEADFKAYEIFDKAMDIIEEKTYKGKILVLKIYENNERD